MHLGVTEEEVLEGLEGARAYNATSLSTPISADGTTELGDTLGGEDYEYELAETRVALGPALATLDEREQKILTLRFYGNLTQSQIADQVGISQMHVSRLLTRALTKLRAVLMVVTSFLRAFSPWELVTCLALKPRRRTASGSAVGTWRCLRCRRVSSRRWPASSGGSAGRGPRRRRRWRR